MGMHVYKRCCLDQLVLSAKPGWAMRGAALALALQATLANSNCSRSELPALVGIFSRQGKGIRLRSHISWAERTRLLAVKDQPPYCQLNISPPESQGSGSTSDWSYLPVNLIFCYSFEEFELLLIWRPAFWQLFFLNGFVPSCQLSGDSGPRITLTGRLRDVKAQQRRGNDGVWKMDEHFLASL